MKWLNKYSEDKKILFRMIGVYTLLSMLVVVLLTGFVYVRFSREIKEQIQSKQQANISAMANTVSFRAEYVNYLMTEARQDRTLYDLFYDTAGDEVEALRRLDELRLRTDQLHSVYVCNDTNDTIYCSSEVNSSKINEIENFEDQGFVELLGNIEKHPKGTPILRQILFESPNGEAYQTYVYTYLMYDIYNESNVKHIMAFNFHMDWISDALNYISSEGKEEDNIWIVDGNNTIVYAKEKEKIGTACVDQEMLKKIDQRPSGTYVTGVGKDKQMVVYATPQQRGYKDWTFVAWNAWAEMLEPVREMQIFSCIVASIFLLISGLAIVTLSNRIFVPIQKLFMKAKKLEADRERNHQLERERFLRRFFQGDFPDDMQLLEQEFQKHQISYEMHRDNRVLLIIMDYASSFKRKYQKNLVQAERIIEEKLREECGKIFPGNLMVGMQPGMWLCVTAEEQYTAEKTQELFKQINQWEGDPEAMFSLAISEIGHSMRDIPYLYSEVMNLQSYLYLLGRNRILKGEDVEQQEQKPYEYPHELEKKFLGYLFSGKEACAVEAYMEFQNEIRTFTVEDMKQCFLILAYAIKRTSYNKTVETVGIMMELEQFYKKLQTLETIEEVNQIFLHVIEEVARKTQDSNRDKHEELIRQIKQYVEENYGEITFSLNMVADRVDMSSAYLGRVFKQVTGSSFVEYLTGYRLQTACDLLLHSEKTVNEISDAVGFTNSSYFYIIFKKKFHCTPGQYRKEKGLPEHS